MKNKRGFTLIEMMICSVIIGVVVIGALVIVGIVVGGAAKDVTSGSITTISDEDFAHYMRQENIQHAVNEGYNWTGCADSESRHTGFSGTKNGEPTSGVICQSWSSLGKATTIRYR